MSDRTFQVRWTYGDTNPIGRLFFGGMRLWRKQCWCRRTTGLDPNDG